MALFKTVRKETTQSISMQRQHLDLKLSKVPTGLPLQHRAGVEKVDRDPYLQYEETSVRSLLFKCNSFHIVVPNVLLHLKLLYMQEHAELFFVVIENQLLFQSCPGNTKTEKTRA